MTGRITRRDFLNGVALTVAGALAPIDQLAAQGAPAGSYPPGLTGLRGSTDAAFAAIHALAREGKAVTIDALSVEETYDLVVVGAGLAGLTAAWLYRQKRPNASILILDAHDDFGGHAMRNEMSVGGRRLLGYGGSESLVSPRTKFKGELGRVLRGLGLDMRRFNSKQVFHRRLYPGLRLSRGSFFAREVFGADRLVTGDPIVLSYDEFVPANPNARPIARFISDCPLSEAAKAGLTELYAGRRDYLPGLSAKDKVARLEKMSYAAFLADVVKLPKDGVAFFRGRPNDNYGRGIDAIPATDLMGIGGGLPGAKSLRIETEVAEEEDDEPYVHHFPDGNASVARAIVRALVKGIAPGRTMEDLVTARFDYGRLDVAGSVTRIRLGATALVVRNEAGGVAIGYMKEGRLHRIKAGRCLLATYAAVMPFICPEITGERKALLASNVKQPLLYTKVAIRSWESFARLGVHKINGLGTFHSLVKLDYPVSLGGYRFPRRPGEPIGLHLVHVPLAEGQGLDARSQARIGRQFLLDTPFPELERKVRADLQRMLGPGGFEEGRDIAAITVNRWAHGYSYMPTTLFDDVEAFEKQKALGRQPIGAIHFASSDTAWDAHAHAAMEEAVRAAKELA